MQALQPLGVVDVALATRNRARIPRVGYDHFDAGTLEHLVDGHPVDAGGFHRNRGHAGRLQPLRHALQIARECLEGLYGLVGDVGRDCDDMESRADVDRAGSRVDDWKSCWFGSSDHGASFKGGSAPDRDSGLASPS